MLQAWSHCHLQTDSAYPGQYANIMQTSIWFYRWRLQPWTTHSNCDLLFSLFLNGRKGFATSLACALPEVLEGNPSHRWLMSRFFLWLVGNQGAFNKPFSVRLQRRLDLRWKS
jgi:hypothetical protein